MRFPHIHSCPIHSYQQTISNTTNSTQSSLFIFSSFHRQWLMKGVKKRLRQSSCVPIESKYDLCPHKSLEFWLLLETFCNSPLWISSKHWWGWIENGYQSAHVLIFGWSICLLHVLTNKFQTLSLFFTLIRHRTQQFDCCDQISRHINQHKHRNNQILTLKVPAIDNKPSPKLK